MTVGKSIGLRVDDEIREAIETLGTHLGTENISQIVRVGFMTGVHSIMNPQASSAAFARQAFREGVLAGAAAFKAHIEAATTAALSEAP